MDVGQYEAGQYTHGFVDGLMVLASGAGFDFTQVGDVVKVTNPQTGDTIITLTIARTV